MTLVNVHSLQRVTSKIFLVIGREIEEVALGGWSMKQCSHHLYPPYAGLVPCI